jgi:hypothetical protein
LTKRLGLVIDTVNVFGREKSAWVHSIDVLDNEIPEGTLAAKLRMTEHDKLGSVGQMIGSRSVAEI